MALEKPNIAPSRAYPYFVLAICAPLALAFLFFVLPQISIFETGKLETIITGYSTLLLGFFAGIRLGSRINSEDPVKAWVTPFAAGPLLGFFVLLLPFSLGLTVLAIGFGALGAWDSWSAFKGSLSSRYSGIRTVSTWIICITLILIFILDGLNKSII